jgi:signal peptidase I
MSDSPNTERMSPGEKKHDLLSELIRFALITLFIVLPIRIYIAQPFIVSGSSMDPTFKDGEYLIIDEISYRFETPDRGDVIVFRYPQDTTTFFIKRIIGLPGETVDIRDSTVMIEGADGTSTFTLDETYLSHPTWSVSRIKLGDGEYFVMVDNRPASSDSRVWGPLNEDLIIGRALVRLLPAKRIDLFPGAHVYAEFNAPSANEESAR